MEFTAVTTCSEKGWKLYGERMVRSFSMYWPKVYLHLYSEGFTADQQRVSEHKLPEWQVEFKARHEKMPLMNGRGGAHYDLTHDAVRFSHKVGAVVDLIEHMLSFKAALGPMVADVAIWIDADVLTHAPVTRDFLQGLVTDWDNTAIAWLDRAKKYPECGFVMFNLQHPSLPALIHMWKRLYTDDLLISLDGWTDCHTLQHVVKELLVPWASLSGGHTNLGHPFVNGPLGAVMDHLKGDRKHVGKSSRHDLRVKRKEHYWRFTR